MGVKGLTARMEVRYRQPALEGDQLAVVARKVSEARRVVDVEARLLREDTVLAEATGRFMKMGPLTVGDLLPGASPGAGAKEE
jgi:acyl-coenzyme A thioesterase PaaI-like protein